MAPARADLPVDADHHTGAQLDGGPVAGILCLGRAGDDHAVDADAVGGPDDQVAVEAEHLPPFEDEVLDLDDA